MSGRRYGRRHSRGGGGHSADTRFSAHRTEVWIADNIRTSKWRKIPCQSPEFPLAASPRLAPGHQRGAVVHGLGAGVVNLAAAITYTLLVLLTALLAKGDAGAGKG